MLGTPLETVAIVIGVAATIIGMVIWGTKSSSRGLVIMVGGMALLAGILVVKMSS